jgi:hypothetical protein
MSKVTIVGNEGRPWGSLWFAGHGGGEILRASLRRSEAYGSEGCPLSEAVLGPKCGDNGQAAMDVGAGDGDEQKGAPDTRRVESGVDRHVTARSADSGAASSLLGSARLSAWSATMPQ